MTTAEALFAAVLARPEDDLPRLVYADYLEENGSPDLANFIRIGCERAKTISECGAHMSGNGNWLCRSMTCPYCPLVRKEQSAWLELSLKSIKAMGMTRPEGVAYRLEHGALSADGDKVATVRRGFVAEVHCTLSQWCGGMCNRCHGNGVILAYGRTQTDCMDCEGCGRTTGIGEQVVASHPVERVVLTDVTLHQFTDGVAWVRDEIREWQGGIPSHIFDLIKTQWHRAEGIQKAFATADEADDAISSACLSLARQRGK